MNTSSLVGLLPYLLALFASVNARKLHKRTNQMPTALKKFDITFLRGKYSFGPSTFPKAKCGNGFIRPIPPSTVQQVFGAVDKSRKLIVPTEDTILTLQQVNGTGLLRNGDIEIKIMARGPIYHGHYVFVVFFDGKHITAITNNKRLFNWFFKRRVTRFIRRFTTEKPQNLLKNRKCFRMLTSEFTFPTRAQPPQDPAKDPP